MARTRGLGRAIDRLIGRDRQDDHDAVDVPERRRLTASAHRQRVHQMTVDAPDMAADVPDMTEDVPDMAEDAPEMTVDIQGDDGAEGSHADDAEGFLGGPRDPSVLTSFADHVAHAVWSGQALKADSKLLYFSCHWFEDGKPTPDEEELRLEARSLVFLNVLEGTAPNPMHHTLPECSNPNTLPTTSRGETSDSSTML